MLLNEKISGNIDLAAPVKRQSLTRQVIGRLTKDTGAMIGFGIILVIVVVALFAPLIAPYDPYELDPTAMLDSPSLAHPFGTDELGRDVLSRIIYGSRYSLTLGLCGAVFGLVLGCIFGCIAGYFGKWIESLIMRICDVMMSIPGELLAIIISSVLGPGFFNTVLALSIGGIPGKVRMLRAQILRERGEEYLEAAVSYNCGSSKIMFKHLLPNVISPLLVGFTMGIGGSIMSAASLSFLGLGIQPPTPEWGAMLSAGRAYIRTSSYLIFFPGVVIMIFVWAINLFGDGLRDALDPKLKT